MGTTVLFAASFFNHYNYILSLKELLAYLLSVFFCLLRPYNCIWSLFNWTTSWKIVSVQVSSHFQLLYLIQNFSCLGHVMTIYFRPTITGPTVSRLSQHPIKHPRKMWIFRLNPLDYLGSSLTLMPLSKCMKNRRYCCLSDSLSQITDQSSLFWRRVLAVLWIMVFSEKMFYRLMQHLCSQKLALFFS